MLTCMKTAGRVNRKFSKFVPFPREAGFPLLPGLSGAPRVTSYVPGRAILIMISCSRRGLSFPVCVTTRISVELSVFKISLGCEWWNMVLGAFPSPSSSALHSQTCLITFKVVAKPSTMVVWEEIQRMSQIWFV